MFRNAVSMLQNFPVSLNLQRRQAGSILGNIFNVPYTGQIFVPNSCCANRAGSSNNTAQSSENRFLVRSIPQRNMNIIISLACSSPTELHRNGCLESIVGRANQQDMGIAIINCFMVVLAFVAMPFLLRASMDNNTTNENKLYEQQFEHMKHFDSNPNNNFPSMINTFH